MWDEMLLDGCRAEGGCLKQAQKWGGEWVIALAHLRGPNLCEGSVVGSRSCNPVCVI